MSELPLNELFASGYQLNHTGYREWKKSFDLAEKNQILSQKVSDLQEELQEAHKRVKELMDASIVCM